MEAIARCTKPGGALVALVKPQFEAGRDAVTKGRGVIRDEAVRTAAIERAVASVKEAGYTIVATTDCVLPGPKGNVEAFVHALRAV
jgi:23S rRNA (cytidine1920-2'-O)/16S rRNA (cytidine1409-2'-O)-methyltransferase